MRGVYGYYNTMGYIVDFDGDKLNTENKIQHLRDNWIDPFTRALILKWTVYNVQNDRYYLLTLFSESPMGSGFAVKSTLSVDSLIFTHTFVPKYAKS